MFGGVNIRGNGTGQNVKKKVYDAFYTDHSGL